MAQTETIQENFFQAIDTIVQNRIANLPYDKTIECEVVEQVITAKNVYKVRYQGVSFEAVSMVSDLQKDDIVYVQIPQNDFRKEKFIIALKRDADTQKLKTLPFLSFIRGNNLFSNVVSQTEFHLQLNSNREAEKQFTFIRFDGEEIAYGFTRMGIKATFGAAINTPLVSGDYGIKIRIHGYDQRQWSEPASTLQDNVLAQPNSTNFYKDFYLKKEDMIGTNLYNTHGFQNQEKVFDITGWVIDSIVVSLWQDNHFTDSTGTDIINKFITITNLQLYLGYDISQVKPYGEPTLILQTKDGLLYKTPKRDDPIITKDIEFKVIQKEENSNTYVDNSNFLIFNQADLDVYPKIEQYNPTYDSSSIYSKKYYFSVLPIDIITWYSQIIDDNRIKLLGMKVEINRNNIFLDSQKNGFCYNILNKNFQPTLVTITQEISGMISDLKPSDYDTYDAYIKAIADFCKKATEEYNKIKDQLTNEDKVTYDNLIQTYNKVLNKLAAKGNIYTSNELWFVHENNKDELDILLNSGIATEEEEEITVPGVLVFTSPELKFKTSDGTVLLKLNSKNSQLIGNAESATYTKAQEGKYNLTTNLEAIESALRALGSDFSLTKEE